MSCYKDLFQGDISQWKNLLLYPDQSSPGVLAGFFGETEPIECFEFLAQVDKKKNLSAMQETWVLSLSQEDPLEKGMATNSSILAWRILWTEELGRLQSKGSQKLRHDWPTNTLYRIDWPLSQSGVRASFLLVQSEIHLYVYSQPPYLKFSIHGCNQLQSINYCNCVYWRKICI